jgi:hypothetical protein
MEKPLYNALKNLKLYIEENNAAIIPDNSLPTINGIILR